jgi:hypothetical protein
MLNINLWSAIKVKIDEKKESNTKLDALLTETDQLTIEEKSKLVRHLIGSSGLNVTLVGTSQLTGSVVIQINTMDQISFKDGCADIIDAIASRVKAE